MATGRHRLHEDGFASKDVGYVPRFYVPCQRQAAWRRISVSSTLETLADTVQQRCRDSWTLRKVNLVPRQSLTRNLLACILFPPTTVPTNGTCASPCRNAVSELSVVEKSCWSSSPTKRKDPHRLSLPCARLTPSEREKALNIGFNRSEILRVTLPFE